MWGSMKDLNAWLQGGVGLSFPAWGQYLMTGWQVLIGLMGGVVLALTIYNKYLEVKQRRRDLAQANKTPSA